MYRGQCDFLNSNNSQCNTKYKFPTFHLHTKYLSEWFVHGFINHGICRKRKH